MSGTLELNEEPEELERTTSESGAIAANEILDRGFGRAKVCTVTTSMCSKDPKSRIPKPELVEKLTIFG